MFGRLQQTKKYQDGRFNIKKSLNRRSLCALKSHLLYTRSPVIKPGDRSASRMIYYPIFVSHRCNKSVFSSSK